MCQRHRSIRSDIYNTPTCWISPTIRLWQSAIPSPAPSCRTIPAYSTLSGKTISNTRKHGDVSAFTIYRIWPIAPSGMIISSRPLRRKKATTVTMMHPGKLLAMSATCWTLSSTDSAHSTTRAYRSTNTHPRPPRPPKRSSPTTRPRHLVSWSMAPSTSTPLRSLLGALFLPA